MPFSTAYKPAELGKALGHGDVHLLIVPGTLFGQDHQGFCEEAIVDVTTGPDRALRLPQLPYLRAVWIAGSTELDWATGVELSPDAADEGGLTDDFLDLLAAEVTPADLAIPSSPPAVRASPRRSTILTGP